MEAARQVLSDAEDDLRGYELYVDPITSNAGNQSAGLPGAAVSPTSASAPEKAVIEGAAMTESPITREHRESLGAHGTGGEVQPPIEAPRQEVAHIA